MNTWISKARVSAALVVLGLAGCDGVALPLPNLAAQEAAPLTQASLSRGAVTLATPPGYCIDPRSLRQRFALIGRCDTLGAEGFFAAWELAIVTASVAEVAPGTTPPDLAVAAGSEEVVRQIERRGLTLTQLRSPGTDVEGVSDQYWRTAFVLGDQLVSLALYAPETSRAVGEEGARILLDIVARTRSVSADASG